MRPGHCVWRPHCNPARSGSWDPDTLTNRNNIAAWTRACGDAAGALRLFIALLPDRERLLGSEHPDTLTTRGNIAACTGECGDAAGALRLNTALLPDRERLLGSEHPDTLTTRGNIAVWTAQIQHQSRNESDQQPLAELGELADEAVTAGETAAAVSYCGQMIAAEEAFGPEDDIQLTGYLRRAASILAGAEQDAQAIETLTRAITINDRYGAETAEALDDLCNLAGLQERNGLHQEARQNLARARDIEARNSKSPDRSAMLVTRDPPAPMQATEVLGISEAIS
jgi:tetratricopeptide (TPR) repeat protein